MLKLIAGLIMLSLLVDSTLRAEEWIGLDDQSPTLIGLQYSEEEQGNHSKLVYLSLPVASSNSLDIYYNQTTLVDEEVQFDSDSLYTGINVEIDNVFAVSLNYQFQGQRDELEIDRYGFQLVLNPYPFSAQLGYSFGEVLLFTQQDIFPNTDIPEKFESDMNLLEVQLGWWFDNFGINLSYQSYDYQKRISALGSRPLLQIVVKPGVLAQADLLLAEQTSLSLQYPANQRSLNWHWSSSRSEVDDSRVRSLQMDWIETINEQTGLLISLGHSDNSDWNLGIGLKWNL